MKKQDLTNDEQMVLSYLVLIDEYVKRNSTSEDSEDEKSLYDQFTQVFDEMNEEQQSLFYENLTSLNEKSYINFEDASCTLADDIVYEFVSLAISAKGTEYVQKYMELDKKELKIAMKKMSIFSWQTIQDACKQMNNNELFKFVVTLATIGTTIGTAIK